MCKCILFYQGASWLITTFNLVKIQQEFSTIVVDLLAFLEERVDASDVHHYLKALTCFSCSSSPDIAPQSYYDIFFSDIWMYDNISTLNSLNNKYLPDTDMKVYIKKYSANLLHFRKSTKLVDFNDKCRNLASSVVGESKEIVCVYYRKNLWQDMQVNVDVREEILNLHLSDIDYIASELCQHLFLSDGESLLTIKSITKTEVILNWRIPIHAMNNMYQPKEETLEVLMKLNIILILSSEDCTLFNRSMVCVYNVKM